MSRNVPSRFWGAQYSAYVSSPSCFDAGLLSVVLSFAHRTSIIKLRQGQWEMSCSKFDQFENTTKEFELVIAILGWNWYETAPATYDIENQV